MSRSGRSGRPLQAAGSPRLAEDGAQGVEARWNQAVPHPQAALVTLDQTGTVTTGRMALVDVVPVGATTVDEVLRLVDAVEVASEHPIAQAIADGARDAVG